MKGTLSSLYEQSAVTGKCKDCKRILGILPSYNLCHTCLDIKIAVISEMDTKRRILEAQRKQLIKLDKLRQRKVLDATKYDWKWKGDKEVTIQMGTI